jgi:hypothetical protein
MAGVPARRIRRCRLCHLIAQIGAKVVQSRSIKGLYCQTYARDPFGPQRLFGALANPVGRLLVGGK